MTRPTQLHAVAPAKVNLGLEIVDRRADGYHDLVTIFQAVSLYDLFEWTATDATFIYTGPPDVPAESDLVARVLASAPDRASWTGHLRLVKRIPMAAGLGGGSTDAALALRLAFPQSSPEELHERASALGADVPFFLRGGSALATGTGTTLIELPTSHCWLVLVTPTLVIERKTAVLYGGLEQGDFSDGTRVLAVAAELSSSCRSGGSVNRPRRSRTPLPSENMPVSLPATIAGDQVHGPYGLDNNRRSDIPNSFIRQLLEYESVRYAYDALQRAGAGDENVSVSVSGAGPTVYALTGTWREAAYIAERLPHAAGTVRIVRSIGPQVSDLAVEHMAHALRGDLSDQYVTGS